MYTPDLGYMTRLSGLVVNANNWLNYRGCLRTRRFDYRSRVGFTPLLISLNWQRVLYRNHVYLSRSVPVCRLDYISLEHFQDYLIGATLDITPLLGPGDRYRVRPCLLELQQVPTSVLHTRSIWHSIRGGYESRVQVISYVVHQVSVRQAILQCRQPGLRVVAGRRVLG